MNGMDGMDGFGGAGEDGAGEDGRGDALLAAVDAALDAFYHGPEWRAVYTRPEIEEHRADMLIAIGVAAGLLDAALPGEPIRAAEGIDDHG
ncbi:MAG: hypothetical protein HQL35_15475 [Alphaproteobacteria bacterium]|nr:hypothetical protein [Alphaproteobacteria bacterium]